MALREPVWLVLLLLLAGVVLAQYRALKRGKGFHYLQVSWKKFFLFESFFTRFPPKFLNILLLAMSIGCLILALTRPQSVSNQMRRSVEGIDIMLVLDLSASMRIEDFRDSNRLDTAKPIIQEFIEKRINDRIGLQVFSGESATLVPPTLDHPLLLQALQDAEIGDLKDGTAIGDALATAVGRLKSSEARSKVVILLTDGDSNVGSIDPLTAGELAKGYGIKVYSIAIGREGRVKMPFVQKDIFGKSHKTYQYFDSSINPELLQKISHATQGKFYRVLDSVENFRAVFEDIDQLEKTKIQTHDHRFAVEKFTVYAWAGFILLMVSLILQNTIFRVYP